MNVPATLPKCASCMRPSLGYTQRGWPSCDGCAHRGGGMHGPTPPPPPDHAAEVRAWEARHPREASPQPGRAVRTREARPPLRPSGPRIIERCSNEDLPIVVLVNHPVITPNRLMQETWYGRARRRRREDQATAKALASRRPPPLPPPGEPLLRVKFTRLGPRALDDDGLSYSFKTPRDRVAYFLGCDDGPKAPVRWEYAQERLLEKIAAQGKTKYAVRFRIEITREEKS